MKTVYTLLHLLIDWRVLW